MCILNLCSLVFLLSQLFLYHHILHHDLIWRISPHAVSRFMGHLDKSVSAWADQPCKQLDICRAPISIVRCQRWHDITTSNMCKWKCLAWRTLCYHGRLSAESRHLFCLLRPSTWLSSILELLLTGMALRPLLFVEDHHGAQSPRATDPRGYLQVPYSSRLLPLGLVWWGKS